MNVDFPLWRGERRRKDAGSDLFKEVKRNEVLKHEGQSEVRTSEMYEQMLLCQGEAFK